MFRWRFSRDGLFCAGHGDDHEAIQIDRREAAGVEVLLTVSEMLDYDFTYLDRSKQFQTFC
jgi:hypothetical protein